MIHDLSRQTGQRILIKISDTFQISDFRFQILVVSKLLSSTVVFCFQALNETGKHPGAKLRPRGTKIIENFEFS